LPAMRKELRFACHHTITHTPKTSNITALMSESTNGNHQKANKGEHKEIKNRDAVPTTPKFMIKGEKTCSIMA